MINCTNCGACCVNPTDNKWIEVTETDAERINNIHVQLGDVDKYAMMQDSSGRCVCFTGKVGGECKCSIYSNRPTICRKVQPGDSICNMLRAMHKIKD